MDNVSSGLRAIQSSSSFNLEVLALPKGALKVVQLVLCLIAFAVVAAFDDSFEFQKNCGNDTVLNMTKRTFHFGYPFDLNEHEVKLPLCETTTNLTSTSSQVLRVAHSDQESSPKFFVFTGVLGFIYCMVAVVAYVFISPTLQSHDGIGFKIDVFVHILICIFWFCGSFALIRAKNQIEKYTSPARIFLQIEECHSTTEGELSCTVTHDAEYRALGFAVGMGFVNLFAWSANIYFLVKDTPWFDLILQRMGKPASASGSNAQRYGTHTPADHQTGESSLPEQHQIPPYNPDL
ncbi:synaptoporin-like [Symsagittifera roscoffensis]|uniref:synaptoporin-like n=1 Tax=Symsagittifera roscoffensis TaxID=84072 RepID=UPI00307C9149